MKFGKVNGYFDCNNNLLTTLKNAPIEVVTYFSCVGNQLPSLEGFPKKAGSVECYWNTVKFTEKDIRAVCDVKGRIHV